MEDLAIMESPVETIRYGDFRAAVVDALRVLADPEYQERVWIRHEFPPGIKYDELDYRVHILFDDMVVLPDPEPAIGALIYPDEVDTLRALGAVFESLIDELGDVGDAEYLAHPRWTDVVRGAAEAYRVLHANDVARGAG
ncbi:SCO4402 family protein [Pseudonocardia endophytica]|uniref:Uncharacterized protein n=1 Tax=Pseudonocardia endophytica TaxID=401976 RepID=A0A4R1HEA8_PSEEN|nr:hypothetical protein [Pseudonocardia endophytica]TCK20424.1 hypothetical protein EV378_4383 [Pseudonocardia endophytica]